MFIRIVLMLSMLMFSFGWCEAAINPELVRESTIQQLIDSPYYLEGVLLYQPAENNVSDKNMYNRAARGITPPYFYFDNSTEKYKSRAEFKGSLDDTCYSENEPDKKLTLKDVLNKQVRLYYQANYSVDLGVYLEYVRFAVLLDENGKYNFSCIRVSDFSNTDEGVNITYDEDKNLFIPKKVLGDIELKSTRMTPDKKLFLSIGNILLVWTSREEPNKVIKVCDIKECIDARLFRKR